MSHDFNFSFMPICSFINWYITIALYLGLFACEKAKYKQKALIIVAGDDLIHVRHIQCSKSGCRMASALVLSYSYYT